MRGVIGCGDKKRDGHRIDEGRGALNVVLRRRRPAMKVREIMSQNPVCCGQDTPIQEVALLMAEHDCGEIPVVRSEQDKELVGVITDRDIACRAVADGLHPRTPAREVMTGLVVSLSPEATIEECCHLMKTNLVRRIPVVENGMCCGMVTQADLILHAPEHDTAEMIRRVSQPTPAASRSRG
jgi:CBS domain-containing protein